MSNQTAQPQKTREERNLERQKRQERKLELAQQPGSHVFQAPVGPEMEAWLQISRTLNDLFPRFKVQSGAFGRISDAKSERLNQAMIQLCLNAAHLCDEISKALPEKHLTFRCPRVMEKAYAKYKKDLLAQQGGGEPSAKTQRPVAVKAVEKVVDQGNAIKPWVRLKPRAKA